MPRYIFETDAGVNGANRAELVLDDVRDAKIAAVRFLGELLSHDGAQFWLREEVSLTVTNDAGLTLFRLCLFGTDAAALPRSVEPQITA